MAKNTPKARDPKSDVMTMIMWGIMIFLLLVFLALPTVIFVFIGMLPSLAAFLIDRSREKYSAFCVTGINITGVFPYLLDLWGGDNTVNGAIAILTVFSLVVMYGAAGVGTLMFMIIPPIAVTFLEVMSQRRVDQLRAEQKILTDEWGEGVMGNNLEMEASPEEDPPPD